METRCHFIILTVLFFFLVFSNAIFTIKYIKVNCITLDPILLHNTKCWTKPINRTRTLVNFKTDLHRPLKELYVNMQMRRRTNIVYRPFLINITENYCDIFAKNRASAYMRVIGNIYMAYTNLNHSCPYTGTIIISDLEMDQQKMQFLSAWPLGEYVLDVLAFAEGRNIIKLQFFFITQMRRNAALED